MTLLILDANILNLIQPGEFLYYVTKLSDVECVPARLAREEAEDSGRSFPTPLGKEQDAPVPLISNHSKRCSNDPAVITIPERFYQLCRELQSTVYAGSTTKKHQNDQEVIASAILLWEKRIQDSAPLDAFFVSGDRTCCRKANDFFNQQRFALKSLFVKLPGGRSVAGVREFDRVFPPH